MRFPLKWLLFNSWLWIIIFSLIAITIGPFILLIVFSVLPMQYKGLVMFIFIFGWGITSGYKEWIISKRQEEKLKMKPLRN